MYSSIPSNPKRTGFEFGHYLPQYRAFFAECIGVSAEEEVKRPDYTEVVIK
jgi:hypothetical protein